MARKISGSCLCGEVTNQITNDIKVFQYCHCSRCRKFTGSAHGANIIVDPVDFEWLSGEQQVGRFEVPDAKYFATSFCKQCGSPLPWLTKSAQAMIIPAGTLDEDPIARPIHNIYYSDRAPWYKDVCELVKYDALPVK
jgi:hypothetical protein